MWKKYYLLFALIGFNQLFGVCTPAGTAGNDIVNCTGSINAFQYLYGGDDIVTLDNVSSRTYYNSYWLDESLGGNPVTDGDDTFIAHYSKFYWVLGFGGNDTFRIDHSQFNNVYADTNPGHGLSQRGDDTINITDSTSYGYILGGNDNDTIVIIDSNVSNVASGYSDIFQQVDYTPFDGNDTILLDHVNFTVPLYWDQSTIEGMVTAGRGDDSIVFRHGGEAYYVYGGHGNDKIEVYDNEHFNACQNSPQNTDRCGIYGDESYATELNATLIPRLHGDDEILLHGGDISHILVQGGDGSDKVLIDTAVILEDTVLNGGDDLSATDGFVDQLIFDQWSGELSGSLIQHWESVVLDMASHIQFIDTNISVGFEDGMDANTGYPYGLILKNSSIMELSHSFAIEGNLYNNAIVDLQDGMINTVLQVSHDYHAIGGDIYLDVMLNDASVQLADTLIVEGDTIGETTLYIDNIGGVGAQTPSGDNDGILLIVVNENSNATFILNDILTAGEYLYKLYKSSQGNWYLRSEKIDPVITLISEANITKVHTPELVHIEIILENTGNVPLTGIVVNDILPDGSSYFLVLQSGDINQNGIFDVGEVWIYGIDYQISQAEVDAGIDLVNKALIHTDQTAVVSEDTVININCACENIQSDSGNSMMRWALFLMLSLFLALAEREEINSF